MGFAGEWDTRHGVDVHARPCCHGNIDTVALLTFEKGLVLKMGGSWKGSSALLLAAFSLN